MSFDQSAPPLPTLPPPPSGNLKVSGNLFSSFNCTVVCASKCFAGNSASAIFQWKTFLLLSVSVCGRALCLRLSDAFFPYPLRESVYVLVAPLPVLYSHHQHYSVQPGSGRVSQLLLLYGSLFWCPPLSLQLLHSPVLYSLWWRNEQTTRHSTRAQCQPLQQNMAANIARQLRQGPFGRWSLRWS